jgi:hypothetical protein
VAAATACGPRVHTPGNSASRYAIESLPRTTGLDWLGMVLIIINRYPPIHRSGNWMSSIESPVSGGIKYHMYIYIYEHALACIEAAEIYFSHIYIYPKRHILLRDQQVDDWIGEITHGSSCFSDRSARYGASLLVVSSRL